MSIDWKTNAREQRPHRLMGRYVIEDKRWIQWQDREGSTKDWQDNGAVSCHELPEQREYQRGCSAVRKAVKWNDWIDNADCWEIIWNI